MNSHAPLLSFDPYSDRVANLNSTQALLTRLESGRVCVPRVEQREVVRLLYVATRHQVKALAAVLELDGLE